MPPQQESQGGMKFIEIVMWGLIVFLILINGIQYFFKIDVQTAVKNLFKGKPEVDIKIGPEEKLLESTAGKAGKAGKNIVNELEADLGLGNLGVGGSGGGQVFNIQVMNILMNNPKLYVKLMVQNWHHIHK